MFGLFLFVIFILAAVDVHPFAPVLLAVLAISFLFCGSCITTSICCWYDLPSHVLVEFPEAKGRRSCRTKALKAACVIGFFGLLANTADNVLPMSPQYLVTSTSTAQA
jgi:hypothetical protein